MPYRLYRTPIPEQALQSQSGTTEAQLARLTQLQGSGSVRQLGTQAGDITLDLQYRGTYAARLQVELKELIDNPTIDAMSLAPDSGTSTIDGYYTADSVDASPATPQIEDVASVRATLVREGSRRSHWLAVETRPVSDLTNPFGNNSTPLVGLPAAAGKVQAVDSLTAPANRATPSIVETVTTQFGDVDRYDPSALSFSDPIYLYDLQYDPQGDVDPSLWDTYGATSIEDADGTVQWGRVFDQSHDFRGDAVFENGHLRVTIGAPTDPTATGQLTAERWDASASAWSTVSLPAEDWAPVDVDVTRIGQARLGAQILWEATASTADASQGDTYAVDLSLGRGGDNALITIPSGDTQGSIPTDLQSLLTPIASDRAITPQASQTLVAREEVRY